MCTCSALSQIESNSTLARWSFASDEGNAASLYLWGDHHPITAIAPVPAPPTITDIYLRSEDAVSQVDLGPTIYENDPPRLTSPTPPLCNCDIDIEKLDLQTPVSSLRCQARVNKNIPRPTTTVRERRPQAPVIEDVSRPVPMPASVLPSDFETICLIERRVGSDHMQYRCRFAGCEDTFGRLPDFTRHYDGRHAHQGPTFWCPEQGCPRSEGNGGKPFPRKDKMMDHMQKIHKRISDQACCKRRRHM